MTYQYLSTMIMSPIMSFIIIATPTHDALVSVALYSVVASALLDTEPVGMMLQALHYMIRHILSCKHVESFSVSHDVSHISVTDQDAAVGSWTPHAGMHADRPERDID